jgi:hypothetical protein
LANYCRAGIKSLRGTRSKTKIYAVQYKRYLAILSVYLALSRAVDPDSMNPDPRVDDKKLKNRRSLQPSKENIKHFRIRIANLDTDPGTPHLIRIQLDPDPHPTESRSTVLALS